MDGMDGRLTMAAGGLVPGAQGRRENVDAQTAEKLARLVEQDDPQALEPQMLGMIVSAAKHYRRHYGDGGQDLTLEDVQAWVWWRQLHPHEGTPPEPEPELLDAKFKIKLGYGGRPVDVASAAGPTEFSEEFHVVVCDDNGVDRPRSITVWRLGGAADADTAVSSGVLHGCRAVRCSNPRPPGAFQLELANMPANIPDGQEGSGSYYFLPTGNQSSEELVAFFNRCGSEPPRDSTDAAGSSAEREPGGAEQQPVADAADAVPQAPGSVRHTWSAPAVATGSTGSVRTLRGFEVSEAPDRQQPKDVDVPVLSIKITGTEEVEEPLKGGKVTHYLVECTPLNLTDRAAGVWVVRKRYSHFDEFRKELEIADSSSEVDTLGLKDVPFPAKTWGISTVGQSTVGQRQQKLEEWLNKIIGLNNALLCSDHRELADAVQRFVRPQSDSTLLTMDQLQTATGGSPMMSQLSAPERDSQQQITEEAWRTDQITGEDGYLETFEQQLFQARTSPTSGHGAFAGATAGAGRMELTRGLTDDGTDRVVQELQQVLSTASGGGGEAGKGTTGGGGGGRVGCSAADATRLVKSVQAELTARDETISQLRLQVKYEAMPLLAARLLKLLRISR